MRWVQANIMSRGVQKRVRVRYIICYIYLHIIHLILRDFFSVPSGPPEKLHCVALTSTTIQVSWHPPEQHLQNGVISGYKVVYAPHPGLFPLRQ